MATNISTVRFHADDHNPARRNKVGVVIEGASRRVIVMDDETAATLAAELQRIVERGPIGNAGDDA